jgi:hypothetical protein
MPLSSTAIGAKAAKRLQDKGFVRFTLADMASWINAACRLLVRVKPTLLTANVAMLLVAGTKQTLSGATFVNTVDGSEANLTALQILEAVRNLGAEGTEALAGSPITVIPRATLDQVYPGWHGAPAQEEIVYLMFDAKDPESFYVYPRATASPAMYVELMLARLPVNTLLDEAAALGSGDLDAGIGAIYEDVLVDAVCYQAFSVDAEQSAASGQLAAFYLKRVYEELGVKLQNEVNLAPKAPYARAAATEPRGQ